MLSAAKETGSCPMAGLLETLARPWTMHILWALSTGGRIEAVYVRSVYANFPDPAATNGAEPLCDKRRISVYTEIDVIEILSWRVGCSRTEIRTCSFPDKHGLHFRNRLIRREVASPRRCAD